MWMKIKVLALAIVALSVYQNALSSPYNACKPFYIGGELGGCDTHYRHSSLADYVNSVNDSGLAGRLTAGYNLNPALALELGYTLYKDPVFDSGYGVKARFSQQSLDFLAKVSMPLSCNVSAFAKGGLSMVYRDEFKLEYSNDVAVEYAGDDKHVRPMLAIGVNYDFNPSLSGTLGYYRTFGTDNLEDADFYGAGLTFRLG